ncbi:MAG: M48 family metallopeptidase [Lewinellaceae bacterium]|nr:M48 family metallopeptidase [Phaeodactylibacter sp.]MCB9037762.1 M48 family metallopeptidase [Lewinellaceae bacterium]
MAQITVSGIAVDIVRKDIKNMHLAVYPPDGRIRLAVPLRVTDEAARLFAISKLGWIKRHRRRFEEQEREPPREFRERESHYFLGRRYLLRIRKTEGAGRVELKGNTYLDLYVPEGASLEYKERTLNEWYRKQLKQMLPEMVARWEQKMDLKVNFWGVKRMKTKWGSCNIEQKRIWLNLELARKPASCLEYILVHEMAHLLERHHNGRFKALMDHYLPNWKHRREELNRLPVRHVDWGY